MSLIPEYKKTAKEAKTGPTRNGLRLAAGVTGLITGILLGLAFILISLSDFISAGLSVEELVNNLGDNAPLALYILSLAYFIIASVIFILSIYIISIGVKALKGGVGKTLRRATISWSLLMLIFIILVIIGLLGLPSEYKNGVSIPVLPMSLSLISILLILIGAILANTGVSFTRFISGATLLLAGTVLLFVSSELKNGITQTVNGLTLLPSEVSGVSHVINIHELAVIVNPYIIISLIIGAVALIIAPFLGIRNLWISALIGATAFIYGMIIYLYYSIYSINPLWEAWNNVKEATLSEYQHPLAIKAIVLFYTVSVILLLIGVIVGIIAGVLAIVYFSTKKSKLFESSTEHTEKPPSSSEPLVEPRKETASVTEQELPGESY